MIIFLYLLFFLLVTIPTLIFVFIIIGVYSRFGGALFLPTSYKHLGQILDKAELKKGQTFLELGSGDGRVVRMAVKKYKVLGIGLEINPFLLIYSKLISKAQRLKNIKFIKSDFFKYSLRGADIIFLFLSPETIKKLNKKLKDEAKRALIVSHGYKIQGFEKFLKDKTLREDFPTYYYRLNKQSPPV